jgi:hypothetical protein
MLAWLIPTILTLVVAILLMDPELLFIAFLWPFALVSKIKRKLTDEGE